MAGPSPVEVVPTTARGTVLGATRVELLEDLGRSGWLVRLLDGPRAGIDVVVPAGMLTRVAVDDHRGPPAHPGTTPDDAARRAESLLQSVLRPSQRHQRATAGTFWIHVPTGWFRLGVLYDLRFRSARWPWVERSVCVVSEGYAQRPPADLWAELTVVLAADAASVVGVANWNREDPLRAPARDRAGLTRWLVAVRDEHRRRVAAGDELHAAYLAADTAVRLDRAGKPGWAAPFAASAQRQVQAWADRWPDERAALLDAHRALLDLPSATAD